MTYERELRLCQGNSNQLDAPFSRHTLQRGTLRATRMAPKKKDKMLGRTDTHEDIEGSVLHTNFQCESLERGHTHMSPRVRDVLQWVRRVASVELSACSQLERLDQSWLGSWTLVSPRIHLAKSSVRDLPGSSTRRSGSPPRTRRCCTTTWIAPPGGVRSST